MQATNRVLEPLPTLCTPHKGNSRVITAKDLPQAGDIQRWSPANKAIIVLAVKRGLISRETALTTYELTEQEFGRWEQLYNAGGRDALRITKAPRLAEVLFEEECRELPTIRVGNLVLHTQKRSVGVEKEEFFHIGKILYAMLELFCVRKNEILSKDFVYAFLYAAAEKKPDPKIIDVFKCKIVRMLEQLPQPLGVEIETVWGRGYVLREWPQGALEQQVSVSAA